MYICKEKYPTNCFADIGQNYYRIDKMCVDIDNGMNLSLSYETSITKF